jgi:hypothetical protein
MSSHRVQHSQLPEAGLWKGQLPKVVYAGRAKGFNKTYPKDKQIPQNNETAIIQALIICQTTMGS